MSLSENFVETHITWNYVDTGVSTKIPQMKEGEILVFHAVFLTLLSIHLHVIVKVGSSLKVFTSKTPGDLYEGNLNIVFPIH